MPQIEWDDNEDFWGLDVFQSCAENYPGDRVFDAPDWVRNVYFISQLQAEVFNGGFNQYIYNTGGKYLDDAIAACEKVGVHAFIPLIREGADAWLEKLQHKLFKSLLDGTLEGFSKIRGELDLYYLDKQFYDQDPAINERIKDYIKKYKSEMV